MKKWAFRCTVFLLCFWINAVYLSSAVFAHTENSEGYSNVILEEDGLRYELYIDYFELARVIDLGVNPGASDEQLNAALRKNAGPVSGYLNEHLKIIADGVEISGELADTSVAKWNNDRDYAQILLNYPASSMESAAVVIRYSVFFDDNDEMHRNILTYGSGDSQEQFVLQANEREFKAGNGTLLGQVFRFLQLGFHHILIGYDHILFVVALMLGARKISDMLKVVTVFTLAHSVTLGLTALDLIRIPAEIVEPLIALSIAYVAIENILFPAPRFRLAVVFGFGLFHGVGFAGALNLTGDLSWKAFVSILSFNLGVEAGQILVIVLLFPLLLAIRKYKWSKIVHGTATAGIFIFGMMWYLERFFGI